MYKMTVIYSLDESVNKDEFIEWRRTVHEAENASEPGCIKTNCYVAIKSVDNDLVTHDEPVYQFVTELYYNTLEDLEGAFFTEEQFNILRNSPWPTSKREFIISKLLSETINQ